MNLSPVFNSPAGVHGLLTMLRKEPLTVYGDGKQTSGTLKLESTSATTVAIDPPLTSLQTYKYSLQHYLEAIDISREQHLDIIHTVMKNKIDAKVNLI
ncbi:hypothetical protein L1987_66629 [Smallanthus sonchifolius]|uniref:Uncharacterized protein n=1 Tax=Smallanthus sonchifolius TaxID=185202 RepID=A0ACB9BXS7_9ASTR|nr:hypothetical protein L1987_66629 [Smallanthus sonchifolius]